MMCAHPLMNDRESRPALEMIEDVFDALRDFKSLPQKSYFLQKAYSAPQMQCVLPVSVLDFADRLCHLHLR